MSLVHSLRQSYQAFRSAWSRMADSAFGTPDEMARGEFTSAFIIEGGRGLPDAGRRERTTR